MHTSPIIVPVPIPIPEYRRRKNNYHFDYSPKRSDYVEFDGPLEFEFWVLKEGDPSVRMLCHQPYKISEMIHGKKLTYTFDLWTDEEIGDIWWDVKEARRCVRDVNGRLAPAKWSLVEAWAAHYGVQARFVTEHDVFCLKNRIFIKNWKEMLRHIGPSSPQHTEETESLVIKLFIDGDKRSFADIHQTLYRNDPVDLNSAIVRLLHRGQLTSDVDARPFNMHTKVWACRA